MGLRFRKTFGSGPFKVSLSKSGMSYSVGTKGARITKKAKGGVRTSVGANGVYYTKDFGGGTVSRNKKTKKKSGCLTWIGGIIAVLAVIGLFGSCSPEEETPKTQEEQPAIVEEQETAQDDVIEEEPEEKEVIEFEPVFVDPFTGQHATHKDEINNSDTPEILTQPEAEETPVVENPVVVAPADENPVLENADPVVPPVVEQEPPVVESDPAPQGEIVYITNTGSKYHRAGCRHLDVSQIAIDLSTAEFQGYTACKNCH